MVALLSLRLLGDRVMVFISMACWLRHAVALGSFWLVTFLACLGVPQCGLTLPHGLRTFGVSFLACLGVPQCGLTLPHGLRSLSFQASLCQLRHLVRRFTKMMTVAN